MFVTGSSGAGQSQAIKCFEDLGFYCVEHLPPIALEPTLEALANAGYADVAVTLDLRDDARLGDPLEALERAIAVRRARLLFLDADDDVLVRRFSATRRRHPHLAAGSLREAIAADRQAMAPFRERADSVLDTSGLSLGALKERIAAAFVSEQQSRMNATLVAFGFKYGLPLDVDLLFDVRFLRNPNYEPELAALTGNDPAVAAFIADDSALEPFLERTTELLRFLLPHYRREGKSQLTIGIGCTGGRHRSVYVARLLAEALVDCRDVALTLESRDVNR